MADTSKDGVLLDGGIRHVTARSPFARGSKFKQVPACVRNILNAFYFQKYFVCLCERIFN